MRTAAGWARRPKSHEHLEQFNQQQAEQLSVESLHVEKPYRKLVAIRSPYNLAMLERCLDETDPETTDVVVMTASVRAASARATSSRRSPSTIVSS